MKNSNYPPYNGTLDQTKLTGLEKSAYTCWANQRRRCYVKSNPRYKDNGAKGITVEYSSREFIAWYLHHVSRFKGKRPSVGRIDHSLGYRFDNIQIEELSDNSMERILRVGTTRPRRKINILRAGKVISTVASIKDASRLTGCQEGHIPKYCRGILKQTVKGFTFRYAEDP